MSPTSSWLEFEKLSTPDSCLPDRDLLARLLMSNSCYEAMPVSGRLTIFDQKLLMWDAFMLLVNSESRHVLLSDSEHDSAITGILSVTDFIRIIIKMFREKDSAMDIKINDLGVMTIKQFRELVHKAGKLRKLVSISVENSLLDAVRILSAYRVHSLPVLDPLAGNPVAVLTHKRILKFIWAFGRKLFHPDHFAMSPRELDIGTWSGVRVVGVLDVYSRFDAIGVALHNEGLMLLNASVKEALEFKHICQSRCERVVSVRENETFYSVISTLVHHKVHRVCVVDANHVLQGIISLSDVLKALVLEPAKYMNPRSAAPRRVSQESFDLSNMTLKGMSITVRQNHHVYQTLG
ncbi:CBS domain protein [Necator americanus]|uniref:CBS domain protein n=1 Tax=Necator americanus TaxID=51031 RepID=W2SHF2_NECAM|nr:CBS domain protein [Necator americanus]ETN69040.1 CBS domain protein [Necator americanus]